MFGTILRLNRELSLEEFLRVVNISSFNAIRQEGELMPDMGR
jgi:hypothetical protein